MMIHTHMSHMHRGLHLKKETGADMAVLIICDVRGGMSPGKYVTAGKSGNSKKKKKKKQGGGGRQGTSEIGGFESWLV